MKLRWLPWALLLVALPALGQPQSVPRLEVRDGFKGPVTTDCTQLTNQKIGNLCFESDVDTDGDGTGEGVLWEYTVDGWRRVGRAATGNTCAGACAQGTFCIDNDATAGENLYACLNGAYVRQVGGGSGPGGALPDIESTYGAVCDGVSDTAAAIESASVSGVVRLPRNKTCRVTTTIDIVTNKVRFVGEGERSIIDCQVASGCITVTLTGTNADRRIELSDFKISQGVAATGPIINITAANQAILQNVVVDAQGNGTNAAAVGVALTDVNDSFVLNPTIQGVQGSLLSVGIDIANTASANRGNSVIVGGLLNRVKTGVRIASGASSLVNNVGIDGTKFVVDGSGDDTPETGTIGIDAYGQAEAGFIRNARFERFEKAISLNASDSWTIENNDITQFDATDARALLVTGDARGIVFRHNRVTNSTGGTCTAAVELSGSAGDVKNFTIAHNDYQTSGGTQACADNLIGETVAATMVDLDSLSSTATTQTFQGITILGIGASGATSAVFRAQADSLTGNLTFDGGTWRSDQPFELSTGGDYIQLGGTGYLIWSGTGTDERKIVHNSGNIETWTPGQIDLIVDTDSDGTGLVRIRQGSTPTTIFEFRDATPTALRVYGATDVTDSMELQFAETSADRVYTFNDVGAAANVALVTTAHATDRCVRSSTNTGQYTLTGTDCMAVQYLTLTTNADLTGERTLAVGQGLGTTDGGANGAFTIDLNLQANAGLSKSASGLSIIRTCGNGQVLKWNTGAGGSWDCSDDTGGSGSWTVDGDDQYPSTGTVLWTRVGSNSASAGIGTVATTFDKLLFDVDGDAGTPLEDFRISFATQTVTFDRNNAADVIFAFDNTGAGTATLQAPIILSPQTSVAGYMDLWEASANGTNTVGLTSPSSVASNRRHTIPDLADSTLAVIAGIQTLTGKVIDGDSNTLSSRVASTCTGQTGGIQGEQCFATSESKMYTCSTTTCEAAADWIAASAVVGWTDIGDQTGNGAIALGNTTQSLDFVIPSGGMSANFRFSADNDATSAATSTSLVTIQQGSGSSGSTALPALLLLDNADAGTTVTAGLKITSSGAGLIATGLDISGSNVTTAVALGSNQITVGGATISSAEFAILDGNIDISGETNLSATSPVVLTGDVLSFSHNVAGNEGVTWGTGGTSFTWTFDSGTTDPVITFGEGVVNVSTGTLQQGGVAVALSNITLTGGVGIAALGDLTANRTVTFDATEVTPTVTWGAGSFTTMTFDAGATDPVISTASNLLKLTTAEIRIGDAGTVTNTDGDGDLYVEDELEVDGIIYIADLNVADTTPTFADGSIPVVDLASEVRSMYWPAGSMSTDGAECSNPAEVTINSGPKVFAIQCPMATAEADGYAYGQVVLPDSFDAASDITFEISVYLTADAGAVTIDGTISIQCKGALDADPINNTWDVDNQGFDITEDAGDAVNEVVQATTAAVDTAACAAGNVLFWKYKLCQDDDGAPAATTGCSDNGTDENDIAILGMKMEYTTLIGD